MQRKRALIGGFHTLYERMDDIRRAPKFRKQLEKGHIKQLRFEIESTGEKDTEIPSPEKFGKCKEKDI